MVKKILRVTKGKVIAGIIAIIIAGFVWGLVFPPGGSGANILLGLFVAIFFVYYFSGHFGGIIDQELFPGGSRHRARLYRSLEKFVNESHEHVSNVKKNKRKLKKISKKALDNLEKSLIQATLVLNDVSKKWQCDEAKQKKHEAMLQKAYDDLDNASRAVFSLKRNWRFLYGVPSLIIALFFALLLREFVVEPYQIPSGSMIPSLLVGDHLFVSKFYYGLSKPFTSDPDFMIQWREPKPGDVVIFKAPNYVGRHANQSWIKRVIATEGQSVKIRNHVVYVDDDPYPHIQPKNIVNYMDYFGFGRPSSGTWKKQRAFHTIEKINDVTHDIYLSPFPPSKKLGPYWPVGGENKLHGLSCTSMECTVKKGHVLVMGDNRGNSHDSRSWGALPVSRIKGRAWFIWMSVDGSGQSVEIGPFNLPKFRFDRWFKKIE